RELGAGGSAGRQPCARARSSRPVQDAGGRRFLTSARLYKFWRACHSPSVTTDSEQTHWSVAGLLDLFDARPADAGRFIADTGIAAEDERQVVEGTQGLAQVM